MKDKSFYKYIEKMKQTCSIIKIIKVEWIVCAAEIY